MDIFLFPGDSPLTITPGDKTVHIRVSSNMDANLQNPPLARPAQATPAAEQENLIHVRPRWRRPILIGLVLLGGLYIGLYSHSDRAPASSPALQPPHLALLAPPEFPSRPVMRPPALPRPQPEAIPAQPGPGSSPLNQAFGLR